MGIIKIISSGISALRSRPKPQTQTTVGDSSRLETGNRGSYVQQPAPKPSSTNQIGSPTITRDEASKNGSRGRGGGGGYSPDPTIVNAPEGTSAQKLGTGTSAVITGATATNLQTSNVNRPITPAIGEVGTIPPVNTNIMTIPQKIAYTYQQADIKFGGYLPAGITPAEAQARNNAQKNAESYTYTIANLKDKSITELINLKSDVKLGGGSWNEVITSGVSRSGFYDEAVTDLIIEKITAKINEIQQAETKPLIDNKIGERTSFIEEYVNGLQNQINSGEITLEQAKVKLDAYQKEQGKELEKDAENISKQWYDSRGQYLVKSQTLLLKDINITDQIRKQVTTTKLVRTAILIGATVGLGASASAGLFGAGAVSAGVSIMKAGTVAGVGLGLFEAGKIGVDLTTSQKAGTLTKMEIIGSIAPFLTYTVVGIEGGVAGGLIGGKVASSVLTSKASGQAKSLQKNILKSPELQKKYWTEENIKRGYFEQEINGIKFKLTTPTQKMVDKLNTYKLNKGKPTLEQVKTYGTIREKTQGVDVLENNVLTLNKMQVKVDTSEMGYAIQKTPTGGTKRFNIVKVASQVAEDGRAIYLRYTVNSKGKMQNIQQVVFTTQEGKTTMEIFRPARPSEIKKTIKKFNVEGYEPVEIFPVGAMKSERILALQTKTNIKGQGEMNGKTYIASETDSFIVTEGFRTGEKVLPIRNIFAGSKEPAIIRLIERKPIAGGRSKQVSIITTEGKVIYNKFGQPIGKVRAGLFASEGKIVDVSKIQRPRLDLKIEKIPSKKFRTIKEPSNEPPSPDLFQAEKSSPITPNKLVQETDSILKPDISSALGQGLPQKFAPPKISIDVKSAKIETIKPSTKMYSLNLDATTEESPIKTKYPQVLNKPILIPKRYEIFGSPQDSLFGNSDVKIRGITKTGTASVTILKPIETVRENIKQETSLFQPSLIKPTLNIPTTITPLKPVTDIPFFGLPPLPFLGKVETGGGQRAYEQGTGIFGKTKYNPSLGSVLLRGKKKKVTKEEYESLSKQKYSGLNLRPEIEIVEKKKRKKLFNLF